MSIENTNMINKRLKIIEDLSEELNRIKSVYQESLDDSKDYQEVQEQAKKFREETKNKKNEVLENPQFKKYQDEIKKVRDEITDNKEVLALELADYYKETGKMQFTDSAGNVKRIVFSVKLLSDN